MSRITLIPKAVAAAPIPPPPEKKVEKAVRRDVAEVAAEWRQEVYKVERLREMGDMWKGTTLEPHTVKLLSMLITEDGTVTAERRHDCEGSRGCYAIGIQGHHICHRGTPLVSIDHGMEKKPHRYFCRSGALKEFEQLYPGFSFDWRIQFAEYTIRMKGCIDDGNTVNRCIQNWNSREVGRIGKVETYMAFVKAAI